jgi:hypothetical protein
MMVIGVWALASSASAQVSQGQFKLSLDTELIGYARVHETFKDETTVNTTGFEFGPAANGQSSALPGPVGITLGYVVHRYVIPQVTFSFGVAKSKSTLEVMGPGGDVNTVDVEGPRSGVILFSPRVEVPLNPDSRAVFGAIAGIDFRRSHYEQEANEDVDDESYDYEETDLGYGATLGATGHFFIAAPLSLDVSALLTLDKVSTEEKMDGHKFDDTHKSYRQFTFGILVGLSAWPGIH